MGIRPVFSIEKFNSYVEDNVEKLNKSMVRRLRFIAEKCIIEARERKDYKDHTGNLKNSVGYVIIRDRKPISWSRTSIGQGTEEARAAREDALDAILLDDDIPQNGVCLVMVAGMGYAAAVESWGYIVLSGAEELAAVEIKAAIVAIQKNINKALRNA